MRRLFGTTAERKLDRTPSLALPIRRGSWGAGSLWGGLHRASLPRHKHDLTRGKVDPRDLSAREGYASARIARFEGLGEQKALRPSQLLTMQFRRDRGGLEGAPRGQ